MTATPNDVGVAPTADTAARVSRPLTDQEAREFASVLRVSPEVVRLPVGTGPAGEGGGIDDYERLVADPIKTRLAKTTDYYHQIKVDVVRHVARTRLAGTDPLALRVLDVGCGTGHLMHLLERHFGAVRGCDPSWAMVRRAGPKAHWMSRQTELPFRSGSFDVAICACVYHHIHPAERVSHLREVRRVLRYDGLLLVFEHNPRNPLTRYIVNRCPIDEAAQLLDGREMARLMRDAGFDDVRTRHYLFFPEFIYARLGQLERCLSWTRLGGQYCAIGRNRVPLRVRRPRPRRSPCLPLAGVAAV